MVAAKVEGLELAKDVEVVRIPVPAALVGEVKKEMKLRDSVDSDGGAVDGDVDGVATVKVNNPVAVLEPIVGRSVDFKVDYEIRLEE